MTDRGQRIGGLAALRNGHHQRPGIGHAGVVAELAGDLHACGDLGKQFDPVARHQARVVAGAAGDDQHRVDRLEDLVGRIAEQFGHDALHAFQGVRHRTRLLEDLLLHVVTVRPEFGRARMRLHGQHRAFDRAALGVDHPVAVRLDVDQVAVVQVGDAIGHAGQRHRVGRHEVLALAHAHYQRRAETRTDDPVRLGVTGHRDGVGALQPGHRLANGLEQVVGVQVVDQVGHDFGVGLAAELVAGPLQLGAQGLVVLDDAVVDQGDPRPLARRREVRMGIVGDRRAMSGPAGVGDAGAGVQASLASGRAQIVDPGGAASAAQPARVVQRQAAGVVAAVFEPG